MDGEKLRKLECGMWSGGGRHLLGRLGDDVGDSVVWAPVSSGVTKTRGITMLAAIWLLLTSSGTPCLCCRGSTPSSAPSPSSGSELSCVVNMILGILEDRAGDTLICGTTNEDSWKSGAPSSVKLQRRRNGEMMGLADNEDEELLTSCPTLSGPSPRRLLSKSLEQVMVSLRLRNKFLKLFRRDEVEECDDGDVGFDDELLETSSCDDAGALLLLARTGEGDGTGVGNGDGNSLMGDKHFIP